MVLDKLCFDRRATIQVDSGELRWSDWKSLRESYDAHKPDAEGLECARYRMSEPHEDAEQEDLDEPAEIGALEVEEPHEDGEQDLDEPHEDEEQGSDSAVIVESGGGSSSSKGPCMLLSSAPSAASSSSADPAMNPEDVEAARRSKAAQEIEAEMNPQHLRELAAMRAKAMSLGDSKTAAFLDQRIYEVQKQMGRPDKSVSVHLRQKALERRDLDSKHRIESEAVRQRASELAQEEKLAKTQLQVASAENSAARAALKQQVEDFKQKRLEDQQKNAEFLALRAVLKRHFAARLSSRCLVFSGNKEATARLDIAARSAVASGKGLRSSIVPDFFEPTRA